MVGRGWVTISTTRYALAAPYFALKLMPLTPADIVNLRVAAATLIKAGGWNVTTWGGPPSAGKALRSPAICARRGRVTVSVEVPAMSTSMADILARQRQYDRAKVRCLWLMATPDFPVRQDLPAVFIDRDRAGQFIARLPGQGAPGSRRSALREEDWPQTLPLPGFLNAAFGGMFWFGTVREGRKATVRLDGEFTKCPNCGAWTNLCQAVEVLSTYPESGFAVYPLEAVPPGLLPDLVPSGLAAAKVGPIRKRYIPEEKGSRIANSCVSCQAVQPPMLAGSLVGELNPVAQFEIDVSKRLASVTALLPSARWRVSVSAGG